MPALIDEPALSFWLRYAEHEGALVEQRGDHAFVLLSEPLQDQSEFPDEIVVTAEPDIAREDGAVLLIAGHPAIERAAAAVLAAGDVGAAYVPWPASRPPSRSTLESRAREQVAVDHGRIDAAGEPIASYLPLLRVGATVGYAASLTLRFQELEEIWTDGRTGTPLAKRLEAALEGRALRQRPDGSARVLPADLAVAVAGAHEGLNKRAAARERALATHAARALDVELARAEAYYAAALDTLARRRANAPPDRARLLDDRAASTRAERDRRRREIEDEYRPRHEIRPFRLHLVHVPAFSLAVDVRRGQRAFPFELTWIPLAGEFAQPRCPACGAGAPLVAGRDRLGCAGCAGGAGSSTAGVRAAASARATVVDAGSPEPEGASARPGPAVQARSGDAGDPPAPVRSRAGSAPASRAAGPRASPSRAQPAAGRRATARLPDRGASSRAGIERIGDKLAFAFWQCVANRERWPRQKAARDSPLRAVYRLYGAAGPQLAIGIPAGAQVDGMIASTYPGRDGVPEQTLGTVTAGGRRYPYAILWELQGGKPLVGEVMPAPSPLELPAARGPWSAGAASLRDAAPAPTVALDPVAATLWDTELAPCGLPFVIRCLATWWRVAVQADPGSAPEALAAAVALAVVRAAGKRRSRAETAAIYRADLLAVEGAEQALGAGLRLDRPRGW